MAILRFAVFRLVTMLITLLVVSVMIFIIINLPPGDYLSNQINELRATGQSSGIDKAEFLRREYSLDQPLWKQYMIWMGFLPGPYGFAGMIQGEFGWSFEFDKPVADLVGGGFWPVPRGRANDETRHRTLGLCQMPPGQRRPRGRHSPRSGAA